MVARTISTQMKSLCQLGIIRIETNDWVADAM